MLVAGCLIKSGFTGTNIEFAVISIGPNIINRFGVDSGALTLKFGGGHK